MNSYQYFSKEGTMKKNIALRDIHYFTISWCLRRREEQIADIVIW